jgi:hypothetical protein
MKTGFKLKRIGLRAIDRGGSNLLLALFHYHPEFFSLSEKITFDTKDYDSLPIVGNPGFAPRDQCLRSPTNARQLLNWLQAESCSMFRGTDNANKNMDKVRNIVIKIPREHFWSNNETEFKYEYCKHEYDKVCYLIRNPFRVAISTDHEYLKSIVDWTIENLSEYRSDIEKGLDSKIIFLEHLLKNFEEELPKLINWADQDTKTVVDRFIGATFAGSKKTWTGRGHGGFNPYAEVSYERATSKDIHNRFPISIPPTPGLDCAREKLGPTMFDYWYNDKEHSYIHELNLDLI